MKSVVITADCELSGKRYFAGDAIVTDVEATALDDANLITGSPVTFSEAAEAPSAELTSLLGDIPVTNVPAHGSTTNLTAIAGSYADLAAARTSVNTLKGEVETRLDNGEAKSDAIIAALITAGIMSAP